MPDAPHRLREVVEGALALPASERQAFLDRACAEDGTLRKEAASVLEACESGTAFLEPAPTLVRTQAGMVRVPGYEILETLGRGGMGTVYRALQDTPRRDVALKVLREDLSDPGVKQRFQYEVEVLGALRHPCIAQVYDAGVEAADGRSAAQHAWIAMEYVPGARTLGAYVRETDVGIDGMLSLFLDVCDAVEHGHRRGVIHRDLKPDNVLVDERGRVKIIDFGVARITDHGAFDATLVTEVEGIVGTLPYMSPEQVAGRPVDTRSDVYALGVVLYELLTRQLPLALERSDIVTSARRILEDAPARPSSVAPELRGDLEAILLCALDKDPERRYASAGALAEDVRRHREGRPVHASPPSALHQLRLFTRRNKVLVGSLAAVVLVALIGAGVSLHFALESKDAERAAEREAEEAGRQRERFATLFETQFGQSMDAVTEHARAMLDTLGGAPVAGRMLSGTIERLESLETLSAGDPEVSRGLVRAHLRLAEASSHHGNPDPALTAQGMRALERALALVQRIAADGHDVGPLHLEVRIALVRHLQGAVNDAASWAQAHTHLVEAEALASTQPHAHRAHAAIHRARGEIAHHERRNQEAVEAWGREIAALQSAVDAGGGFETRRELAGAHARRANIRLLRFRSAEPIEDYDRALGILTALHEERADDAVLACFLAGAWLDRGMAMANVGRVDAMGASYDKAQAILEPLQAKAPRHFLVLWLEARVRAARAQQRLSEGMQAHPKGSSARRQAMEDALASWRRAIAIYEEIEQHGRLTRDMGRHLGSLRKIEASIAAMLGGSSSGHPR